MGVYSIATFVCTGDSIVVKVITLVIYPTLFIFPSSVAAVVNMFTLQGPTLDFMF